MLACVSPEARLTFSKGMVLLLLVSMASTRLAQIRTTFNVPTFNVPPFNVLQGPLVIKTLLLHHRVVVASTGLVVLSHNIDVVQYAEAQIRIANYLTLSGAALFVTSMQPLRTAKLLSLPAALLRAWSSAAKHGGAKAIVQIGDYGKEADGSVYMPSAFNSSWMPFAGFASHSTVSVVMTEEDIIAFIRNMVAFARKLEVSGWDGIQLHLSQGTLLHRFLSPYTNERTDRFGGSLKARMRIVTETILQIGRQAGTDFVVSVLLGADDYAWHGNSLHEEEWFSIVKELQMLPIDLYFITGFEDGPTLLRATGQGGGMFADFAGRVRALVRKPVCVAGGYRSTRQMVNVISSGKADLIGASRPIIRAGRAFVTGCLTNDSYEYPNVEEDAFLVDGYGPYMKELIVRSESKSA